MNSLSGKEAFALYVNFVRPALKAEEQLRDRLQKLLAPAADYTELIPWRHADGRKKLLVVERGRQPKEGDLLLRSTEKGWKLCRCVYGEPLPEDLWGVITWVIGRPC